jgi:hypothetical protein
MCEQCPLYPQKRTLHCTAANVRFVPKADIQELRALVRAECSTQYPLTEVLAEGAGFAQLRAE